MEKVGPILTRGPHGGDTLVASYDTQCPGWSYSKSGNHTAPPCILVASYDTQKNAHAQRTRWDGNPIVRDSNPLKNLGGPSHGGWSYSNPEPHGPPAF
ncbi:hypothetical protein RUM43_015127 [Polyplax serrata]|uniref:Uncharacterized protein n=1 Tax=Polyplax serrata TaxID=468196 RepID=A0AAN8S3E1_POLSC